MGIGLLVTLVFLLSAGAVIGVYLALAGRPQAALRKTVEHRLQEVERVTGKPLNTKSNGPVTTHKYRWQDGVLEADFVNGVLVAYRIVSN